MAEHAGYDQPGDPDTKKNYGSLPPYQPVQPSFSQNIPNNTTVIVSQQPQPGSVVIQARRPPNYMVVSLFACMCCFWPAGLFAIYYADKANNLASAGDYEGAKRMSDKARNLVITSVIVGIIMIITVSVMSFAG